MRCCRAVLDGASLNEAEQRQVLADAGLAYDVVRDVNGRSSLLTLANLWNRLLGVTKDPFLGLEVGRSVAGDRFGLAAHTVQNMGTFREVVLGLAKYAGLINGIIRCAVDESPEAVRFSMMFHWDVEDLERHAADIMFVALVKWRASTSESASCCARCVCATNTRRRDSATRRGSGSR